MGGGIRSCGASRTPCRYDRDVFGGGARGLVAGFWVAPILFVILATLAVAEQAGVRAPVAVSGASPFASCPVEPDPTDPQQHDLELEPTIAQSPVEPDNVVAAWLQGENLGVVTASSTDGGRSWQRTVVGGMTTCSGGTLNIALNPTLDFGPDGTAYLAATAQGGYAPYDPRAVETQVMVARSPDGGRTWRSPTIPASGAEQALIDFPTVAAEPDRPGAAVVVWSRRTPPIDTTLISRTVDGGMTWSEPSVVATSRDRLGLNWVRALPDGSLVVINWETALTGATNAAPGVQVFRSTDKGDTWTATARFDGWSGVASAITGQRTLHLGLEKPGEDDMTEIAVHTSDDGGQTFAPSRPVARREASGSEAVLAADGTGALAVAFLDGFPTGRVRVLHEHGRSGSWDDVAVTDSTGLPQEPVFYLRPRLTGLRDGFAVVSALGAPQALRPPTDVFVSGVRVTRTSSAARPRIRLSVRPRTTRVGTRTRFRIRATYRRGGRTHAIARATVRFGAKVTQTGKRGRATIRRRLAKPGRYQLRARKRGFRAGSAQVRVVRAT